MSLQPGQDRLAPRKVKSPHNSLLPLWPLATRLAGAKWSSRSRQDCSEEYRHGHDTAKNGQST